MNNQVFPISKALEDAPLSPIDGRYRSATKALANYLSEGAINRFRLHIEIEWFIFVAKRGLVDGIAPLTDQQVDHLRDLALDFNDERQARLAELEAETRHDVKAVEYLLREHLAADQTLDLVRLQEIAHLFCTSEDINNLALALAVRSAVQEVWLPSARALVDQLAEMTTKAAHTPMLARTHGQSATPTTVGKEMGVFAWRLNRQLRHIETAEYLGKFNGATGTYSAHLAVLPEVDWLAESRAFVESLGLTWNPVTTQIESHDWQVELYGHVIHFNRVAHNLATDMWLYISLGYFQQVLAAHGSTGSSTMPHKVNPIRFENAESNLELSSALLASLSESLVTTRFQRDLSDSSTQRNIGVGFGYSLVALDNLLRGLKGLRVNEAFLSEELDEHWEVLAEAIQQALRVAALTAPSSAVPGGGPKTGPYELLKELTRGRRVTREGLHQLIDKSDIPEQLALHLRELSPATYVGLAPEIALLVASETRQSRD